MEALHATKIDRTGGTRSFLLRAVFDFTCAGVKYATDHRKNCHANVNSVSLFLDAETLAHKLIQDLTIAAGRTRTSHPGAQHDCSQLQVGHPIANRVRSLLFSGPL